MKKVQGFQVLEATVMDLEVTCLENVPKYVKWLEFFQITAQREE